MLAVISPAKRLDMNPVNADGSTQPAFGADALKLAGYAGKLSPAQLQKLMRISDKLAKLNADRFAEFSGNPAPDRTKPAILAFAGDTYSGLEASTLDQHAMDWAQTHLRILSGLYGVLRPMDLIQPYRLEMGARLETDVGNSLYEFWGSRLAYALKAAAEDSKTDILVNCASVEYFGAVDTNALKLRIITPVFLENRNGTEKIVSFFAKKARGAMARYMMENHLTDPESLKEFDTGGYRYIPEKSQNNKWVFLRDYPAGSSNREES